EERRFRTIDAHGKLRPPFVAAESRVRDTRYGVEEILGRLRNLPRIVEAVAADFKRQAAAAIISAREEPVHLLIAARRVRADDHAGDAGELTPQILGDLIAGTRALILWFQQQLQLPAINGATAAGAAESGSTIAGIHDHVGRFGHQLADHP